MADGAEAGVTIAVVQMRPTVGEKAGNVARSLDFVAEAAGRGAGVIVLPELANSGYVFRSRAEAFALAEPADGPTVTAWAEAAARHGAIIVAGFAEREGAKLFNSAAILGPDGPIGVFRKVHLWGDENLWFEPGDRGFPVFPTPVGRIGVAICYDGWFPETFRLMALQGADLVCVPTNWVPIPGQQPDRAPMANILHMAAAHSNAMFIACADRVGVERGQPFLGHSLIVGCSGWPVAGPASGDREEVLTATVDLAEARRSRRWNDFNQPLRDRRTDVYGEMLGAAARPGWR